MSIQPSVIVKADSGASNHYFRKKYLGALKNVKQMTSGPIVKLPDSSTIQSTKEGNIPLHSSLSPTATKAHIFDNLTNSSLLSIGQLCDDGCTAALDKRFLRIFKNDICIIAGRRNRRDGLWDVSIPVSDNPDEITKISSCTVNAIIRKDTSTKELAEYLYACCGSPSVSTLVKAIHKGNFISWPGIDNINFIKVC